MSKQREKSNKLTALDSANGSIERAEPIKTRDICTIDFCDVPIIVDKLEVMALIDSGASTSIIDKQYIEQLGIKDKYICKDHTTLLRAVNKKEIDIQGRVYLLLNLLGTEILQVFKIVSGLTEKCILGRDAIIKHGIVINGRKKTVYLESEEEANSVEQTMGKIEEGDYNLTIGLTFPVNQKKLIIANPKTEIELNQGIIRKSVKFEPGCSRIILVRLSQPLEGNTACYVTAAYALPEELYLQESVVLVNEKNEIPTHITNRSDRMMRLERRTAVANVELINICTPESEIARETENELETSDICTIDDGDPSDDKYFQKFTLDEDCQELKETLKQFKDIFVDKGEPTGRTNIVTHKINTGMSYPIRQRPYRTPLSQKERVQKEIKEMLEQEVITPSKSPWAAPIVMVLKKDGEYRFCIDYRKLNEITKKDSFPLPRIDATLDMLYGNNLFTTLDLARAYWQIGIDENDKEKTAFIVENNLYEFNVMPFGLVNAPATFQRLINYVLRDLVGEKCLVYLDDIIIFGKTLESHTENLNAVFERIRDAGLKLRPDKCSFLKTEVEFLGHIISINGIKPDPRNIEKVKECRTPTTPREIKSFLGLASYYRKFVEGFSKIAHPMIELTKESVPFVWTEDAELAFQTLKTRLTNPPILAYPDPDTEFLLFTDASEFGIGAVLGQIQNKKEVVIAYSSRHLNEAELKYSTVEKECLALIDAIKRFRSYVLGRHFTLITDHRPLEWLRKVKDNNKRLIRWSLELAEHDFTIKYRPGRIHSNADGMSRLGIAVITEEERHNNESEVEESELTIIEPAVPRILQLQKEDELCREISYYLINKKLLKDQYGETPADPFWLIGISLFSFDEEGILVRALHSSNKRGRQSSKTQTVVPIAIRTEIIRALHDTALAGHLGYHKTYERIKDKFYWPQMATEIKNYCQTCHACQMHKPPSRIRRSPLKPLEAVYNPFDRIAMDLIGPLPETMRNNVYVLTITDYCTRWAEAIPIPNKTAQTVADAVLKHVFYRHGMAKVLLTDNGKEFTANYFQDICKLLKVRRVTTTSYRPQTDGLTERFNKTLMQMTSQFVNDYQDDWDEYLPQVVFAYNTSTQKTTQETPFYLMHGRDPNLPIDVFLDIPARQYQKPNNYKAELVRRMTSAYRLARENTIEAQKKQKELYDRKVTTQQYQLGDRVYLTNPVVERGHVKKLTHGYKGPYRIINYFPGLVYEIKSPIEPKSQLVHLDRIKPCRETNPWDALETEQLTSEVEITKIPKNVQKIQKQRPELRKPIPLQLSDIEPIGVELMQNQGARPKQKIPNKNKPKIRKETPHLEQPIPEPEPIMDNEPDHRQLVRPGLRSKRLAGVHKARFNDDFVYY